MLIKSEFNSVNNLNTINVTVASPLVELDEIMSPDI